MVAKLDSSVYSPTGSIQTATAKMAATTLTNGYSGEPRTEGIKNMLAGLVETVEKLQERIRAHRPLIGSFEVRTRASLIDPILRALDWEVGDPTQVTLERAIAEAGRPDYALLGPMGKPVLLVEAKKLDDTHEPMEQVVGYVIGENTNRDYKIPFCACTNGDVWKVFDVLSQDLVLETSISRDRATDCAFKLLGLWRTSLIDGSLRTPVKLPSNKPIESTAQVHDLGELAPADSGASDRSPKEANRGGWHEDGWRMHCAGATQAEIAEKYGVSPGAVVAMKRKMRSAGRTSEEAHRSGAHRTTGTAQRRKSGAATPQQEFRQPIVDVLNDLGGRGKAKVVLQRVEQRMKRRLNEADYERLKNGQEVWSNKAQWMRQQLKKEGVIRPNSPHGWWELA